MMGRAADRPGESELIARFFAPLARDPGARHLVDDAASLAPPAGCDLVLTTDAVVAGVHFDPDEDAAAIARKALRVNLSDLAAKGAQPIGYLMTLAMRDDWTVEWLQRFADGLRRDQDEYRISLLGGDTVRTPGPLSISIMAVGSVPAGRMVRRDNARAGQRIFVSGTIGDAALALVLAREESARQRFRLSESDLGFLADRLSLPQPRLVLAEALRDHAGAAMDISDGLVGDLGKMAQASGVDAVIDVAGVPFSSPASATLAADPRLLEVAITGGDDYEILAGVEPSEAERFVAAADRAGVPVCDIGCFVKGSGAVTVTSPDGKPMRIARGSYAHF